MGIIYSKFFLHFDEKDNTIEDYKCRFVIQHFYLPLDLFCQQVENHSKVLPMNQWNISDKNPNKDGFVAPQPTATSGGFYSIIDK